jgi:hypothetical protein
MSGSFSIDNVLYPEVLGDLNGNGILDNGEVTSTSNTSATSLTIYPNPSAGIFTVENASAVTVTDAMGIEVYAGSVHAAKLDLSNLENGIYLIAIANNNGSTSNQKIVIQK